VAAAPTTPSDPGRLRLVGAADAGRRIDEVVAEMLGVGRRAAVRLLDEVRRDGRRVRKGDRVVAGDEILLPATAAPGATATVAGGDDLVGASPPVVVRETPGVLVVDKPSGLPSVALAGLRGESLAAWVARREPSSAGVGRPGEHGLAHRLDGETSGLVLVARTDEAWSDLRGQFDRREIEKTYLALVRGDPGRELDVDVPIGRHPRSRRRMVAVAGPRDPVRYAARPARTRVETVERLGDLSVVRARTSSGARHQVRVHLAHAGHPLVGDVLYGGEPIPGLVGFLLHASALRWREPGTGREATDEVAPPGRWDEVLRRRR